MRLRDTRDTFILSAIAMDRKEWIEGLPVIEVTVTGSDGTQALLGNMDIGSARRKQTASIDKATYRITYTDLDEWTAGEVVRPGRLRLHPMSKAQWRTSVKATAKRVLAVRPQWQQYLEWLAEQDAAARAKEAEAETDAVNELVEEDIDIFSEFGAGH